MSLLHGFCWFGDSAIYQKKTMIVSHWNVQNLWNPPFLLHNIIYTCSDSSSTSTFFSEPEILKNPTLSSHGLLPSNPSVLGFQKIRIGPSDQIWMPTLQGCRSGGFNSFHDDHDLPTFIDEKLGMPTWEGPIFRLKSQKHRKNKQLVFDVENNPL